MSRVLGIDVGGTGIKGCIVDTVKGVFVDERLKISTPQPSTPDAMLKAVKKIIKSFDWQGKPIGVGFPAVIKDGKTHTASNIDKTWLDYPIVAKWSTALQTEIKFVNDADAAGLAEMKFGKGKDAKGLVIMLTLGTGIGSSLFMNGELVPNTEFGHIIYNRKIAEKTLSNLARETRKITWKTYGKELNGYLQYLEFILNPDQIIIGGGISKKFELYSKYFALKTPITCAESMNDAGIIGAALATKLHF
ncbi:MAG TPA: ROK family protein [Saprospiraceae bacterium]|nr:ROK family protein [Saprospiraceae bacterium]HPN69789.1 ROK family protein [Saprospiraceae bacterium]